MRKSLLNITLSFAGMCLGFASVLATPVADAAASPIVTTVDNPFAGSWAGTFLNTDTGNGGVMEWTIDDNGRITGTWEWDSGASGDFVGTARPDGRLFVATPPATGGFLGLATIDENGDMVVDVVHVSTGHRYDVQLSPL